MTQKTALFDLHLAAAAKMVDFYGWNMPLNYGSQLQEHVAVRNNCGAFDISHMTFLDFQGKNCKSFLRTLLANDISNLEDDGDGMYSAMLNESGGVIDDLIIYKMPFGYRLIVNCSTSKKDIKWISNHIDDSSVVMLERKDLSMLAIQGPKYNEVISHCLPSSLLTELENKNTFQSVLEEDLFVTKTGYTGELGVEVMLPSKNVEEIWNSVTNTLDGSANLDMFPDAFIANKINRVIDMPFAYFFNLGNFFLIPLAKIAPCNDPIPKTIPNVIRKFSSAICKISKLTIISNIQSFLKTRLANIKQIEKLEVSTFNKFLTYA